MKDKRKGVVRFVLAPGAEAREVLLAGDFSKWKPLVMKTLADGSRSLGLPLAPGVYQYKFIVNGQWITDPDHNRWARSPLGTMNSVASLA